MKLSDLKTGMRVKTREGQIYLVIRDVETPVNGKEDLIFANSIEVVPGSDYSEGLTKKGSRELDIVEVFNPDIRGCFATDNFLDLHCGYSIWKRDSINKPRYYLVHRYLNGDEDCYLNLVHDGGKGSYLILSTKRQGIGFKTRFTAEDIGKLIDLHELRLADFEVEDAE